MKMVFMGTPEFAVPVLNALIQSDNVIAAVVTQPDRPVGRKKVMTPPPVKVLAEENGISVLQYEKVSKDGVEDLKALAPDLFVTCAFGQILSKDILDIPKLGTINVHGSILPKYRGAAPIQAALMNRERKTGITFMLTDVGLDTGDILKVFELDISEEDNAETLSLKLSRLGAEKIVEVLREYEEGKLTGIKQDDSISSYVKMLKKEDFIINFENNCDDFLGKVAAGYVWPNAYTFLGGKQLKVYVATKGNKTGRPGEILSLDSGIEVACKDGSVIIKELLLEGSRRMKYDEFLLGHKLKIGDLFI